MFACLHLPPVPADLFDAAATAGRDSLREGSAALEALARDFSPRVDAHRPGLVTLDIDGLGRLLGSPADIGRDLQRAAADRGVHPRIAIAGTRTAAMLFALARPGVTVVPPGGQRDTLAPLSLGVLCRLPDVGHAGGTRDAGAVVELLRRWGLRTLGDLAALPGRPLSERLGQEGIVWQRLARGEDVQPLVPTAPEEPIEEALDLEWPVEGLEPLSFVLARLFEPLCERLAGLDRAAVALHMEFRLVSRETESRDLALPAPMRDARVLRTLSLLHLEAHPLASGVDRVAIRVEAAPARVTQFSLLSRALPAPEQLATLLARLSALLGERSVGVPRLVDSHRPGAFAMGPLLLSGGPPSGGRPVSRRGPEAGGLSCPKGEPPAGAMAVESAAFSIAPPRVALRRFRLPVPARVTVGEGRPLRVAIGRRGMEGGAVTAATGPWRTSGGWWHPPAGSSPADPPGGSAGHGNGSQAWNRDEWDVALGDGALYRLVHDLSGGRWFVDGILD